MSHAQMFVVNCNDDVTLDKLMVGQLFSSKKCEKSPEHFAVKLSDLTQSETVSFDALLDNFVTNICEQKRRRKKEVIFD